MKYVILLFLFSTGGCFFCPNHNSLDLKLPETKEIGEPDFFIDLKEDSFFYENKKIERAEIKSIIQKMENDIKEKRHVVMGIRPAKSAKMENVVFLMELGMNDNLDVVLDSGQ